MTYTRSILGLEQSQNFALSIRTAQVSHLELAYYTEGNIIGVSNKDFKLLL